MQHLIEKTTSNRYLDGHKRRPTERVIRLAYYNSLVALAKIEKVDKPEFVKEICYNCQRAAKNRTAAISQAKAA